MDIGQLRGRVVLDTSQFSSGINTATGGITRFQGKVIALNQAASLASVGLRALREGALAVFDQVERGAKRVDIESTFGKLANNAGRNAKAMIEELKQATKGALTEMQAMTNSVQAMIAGMDFDAIVVSMEYLSKYAKATDKSFDQLVSTIMTGLARGSVLMLDDAGIIIDQVSLMADAQKKYGRALTEVEKKQVLVNAAVEQMKAKMPALGGEIATQYDHLQSWKAAWEDLQDTIGKWSLQGYGVIRASLSGYQLMYIDAKIVLKKLVVAWDEAYRDIGILVNTKLMDIAMTMRDALNASAVGLVGQDNFLANPIREVLSSLSESFNAMAVDLFTRNENLNKEVDRGNAELKQLISDRARIFQDGVKWMDLAKGNFGDGGSIPKVDLSGTSGTVDDGSADRAKAKADRLKDALDGLQRYVDEVSFQNSIIGVDSFTAAMKDADFVADQLKKQFAEFENNTELQSLIELFRQLSIENVNLISSFEQWEEVKYFMGETFQELEENLSGFTDALTGPLADALYAFAETGKMSVRDLAKSMLDELKAVASSKTARLLMEATFAGIMWVVELAKDNAAGAAKWSMAASEALSGAAVMGSFVAGSGLAGMAHSGITSVPEDGTWLLKKNERVVDANLNKDLKDFMSKGGQNISVTQNIEINGGDEEGVRNALPELKRMMIDVFVSDFSSNGPTRKVVQQYA